MEVEKSEEVEKPQDEQNENPVQENLTEKIGMLYDIFKGKEEDVSNNKEIVSDETGTEKEPVNNKVNAGNKKEESASGGFMSNLMGLFSDEENEDEIKDETQEEITHSEKVMVETAGNDSELPNEKKIEKEEEKEIKESPLDSSLEIDDILSNIADIGTPISTPPTTVSESTTQPPTTQLPTTQPSTAQPATTQPPTTQPPTTQPPTTQPPTTQPPTTQPPTTQPPTTQSSPPTTQSTTATTQSTPATTLIASETHTTTESPPTTTLAEKITGDTQESPNSDINDEQLFIPSSEKPNVDNLIQQNEQGTYTYTFNVFFAGINEIRRAINVFTAR